MRVLFSVHLYPPTHNCGGEYFIHNLSRYLISQGHEVRVLLHQAFTHKIENMYIIDGVMVFPPLNSEIITGCIDWATHVMSHLEYTQWTIEICRIWRKPFFFISHNTHIYNCISGSTKPLNVVYNSQWMADKLQYNWPSIVLHPPISEDKIDTTIQANKNEYITIINCNERKGGSVVKRIAELMPDRKFLFVKGSYDEQIIPELPNVTVMENSRDILPAYRLTKILLMPSAYESWGSTATEAMANGIPVICLPTPGLKENCSYAGIYVDSENFQEWRKYDSSGGMEQANHEKPAFNFVNDNDIKLWIKEIKALDSQTKYLRMSAKCKSRAAELDPRKELEAVEKFMMNAEY